MAALTPKHIARRKEYPGDGATRTDTYLVGTTALEDGADAAISKVEDDFSPPSGFQRDAIGAEHINRNPLWFQVTVTYKQILGGGGATDDPLTRPSILTSSYEEWTEAYFKDESDPVKVLVNSAGDVYDPLPKRRNGSMILQITKNHSSFPAPSYDAIKFTLNAVNVTIRGTTYLAGVLLFLPATVREMYEVVGTTEFHYYQTTFRLAVDSGLHAENIENRGFNEYVPGGKLRPIVDDTGNPVNMPWALDSGGLAKDAGAEPSVTAYQPYASVDWGLDFS